jgi:uncharacterized protein YndB with AHSA1/START domain
MPAGMSVTTTVVAAPPEAVFALLSDPPLYGSFVVGSKRIRRYDPDWPRTGSEFHHTLGVGPLVLRDMTCVEEVDHGRRLVLRAQMRPFSVNRVAFVLRPVDEGTEVEVEEYPIEGPAAVVWNPVFEAAMDARNKEMLRRLKRFAEL